MAALYLFVYLFITVVTRGTAAQKNLYGPKSTATPIDHKTRRSACETADRMTFDLIAHLSIAEVEVIVFLSLKKKQKTKL